MKPQISNPKKMLAILAAVATAVALAFAVSSPFASSSQRAKTERIRLIEREVVVSDLNVGDPSFGPGDRHVIHSDILNRHGKVIGSADFECTATAGGRKPGGICTAGLMLPGGQVVGEFAFGSGSAGSPKQQAITGGTGRYEGARGQFVLSPGSSARTPFVIELVH